MRRRPPLYDGRHAEDAMSPQIATADTVGREEMLDFVRAGTMWCW